jgi:hypothetical protein
MKASLKKNLNNAEYFRLPQMYTDSTFQEMQRAVSEKYAQYMAGPFPESEHQKPYENDGDYQATENDYVPWQYPPWNWPPWITPKWEWPQGDDITPNCLALWNKLFPGWKTGARLVKPRSSEWGALQQLDHAGCLKYIPRYCCPNVWEVEKGAVPNKNKRASGEASILGPSEVEAGQTVEYEYIHAQGGCTYSWDAVKGNITSGTYTAPNVLVDTEDTISVHPFMGDDSAATCAERKIKIKMAGCGAAVPSPTSLQMSVSTTQQLTVANAVVGAVYSWVITAGGGSFSNGTPTTIDYTSAATNAECANNATIELRRGTVVCGTVRIAVNAGGDVPTWQAIAISTGDCPFGGLCQSGGCYDHNADLGCGTWSHPWYCGVWMKTWKCDGTFVNREPFNLQWCKTNYPPGLDGCTTVPSGCTTCGSLNGVSIPCSGTTDIRSAAMKTAGCCPIQLM